MNITMQRHVTLLTESSASRQNLWQNSDKRILQKSLICISLSLTATNSVHYIKTAWSFRQEIAEDDKHNCFWIFFCNSDTFEKTSCSDLWYSSLPFKRQPSKVHLGSSHLSQTGYMVAKKRNEKLICDDGNTCNFANNIN